MQNKMTDEHIFLARQTEGRKIIANKLPSWAENMSILFPAKISLEQCSSEATALYKAGLVSGESLVDLTGGFGVDCSFLSKNFTSVDYVEQNEELCQIAEHNFAALGLNIRVNNAESVSFLADMPSVDCIYIDPARRDVKGKKTADLSLCSPNLLEIRDILLKKCNTLLIKLSPMFDISSALEVFPECKQAHVVSVKNECKELLLLVESGFCGETEIVCVELGMRNFAVSESNVQFTETLPNESKIAEGNEKPEITSVASNLRKEKGEIISYSFPKAYLYEPNASIMKAGLFKTVANKYNVQKLHPSTHLYTSEELVPNFPGRSFEIKRVTKVQKKEIQDIEKANLSMRNFPGNVADLRKKLKLKDGGDVFIFASTLHDNSKALIVCEKIPNS
ncbi:MAG: SAM-dependent methyltransferase [Paludibacteraceae bacterium]|nr:SAM-dependent methyltransferase [Paludibacteraceae bacterium]